MNQAPKLRWIGPLNRDESGPQIVMNPSILLRACDWWLLVLFFHIAELRSGNYKIALMTPLLFLTQLSMPNFKSLFGLQGGSPTRGWGHFSLHNSLLKKKLWQSNRWTKGLTIKPSFLERCVDAFITFLMEKVALRKKNQNKDLSNQSPRGKTFLSGWRRH